MKRHLRIRLGGAALVLLALLTFGASTAFAKTWKCMVINDRINTTYMIRWPDSMSPVQDAIDEANEWDTIWIRGQCPGPVFITKSLTLEGQEIRGFRNAPTIDASGSNPTSGSHVVHVSGSDVQVQIISLILTGGGNARVPAEHGGGILNEDAELRLKNVTITGNWASFGGGIFNDSGSVELTDSTVDSNFARQGQGGGYGGGIFTMNGTVILNASTITNNQLAKYGGGILAWNSTVVANGSEIAHNYFTETSGRIIYPIHGGGILMEPLSGSTWTVLTLTDTTIHHNGAEWGGGIYAAQAFVTLTGSSELSWNHADEIGGGAYVYGDLLLSGNTKVHDNTAIHPLAPGWWGSGGGVAFRQASPTSSLTMSGNAMIYRNTASVDGGGIIGPDGYLDGCIEGDEGDEGVNVFDNQLFDISFW